MICPRCKTETRVVDSRQQTSGTVRRRRECGCGRFTTYEIRSDSIDRTIEVKTTLKIGLVDGQISTSDEIDLRFLCECGNEARYAMDEGAAPCFCGLCDIEKNDGEGLRR